MGQDLQHGGSYSNAYGFYSGDLVRIPAGTTTVLMSGAIPLSLGISRDSDGGPVPLQATM
jgi:hypothetical protein